MSGRFRVNGSEQSFFLNVAKGKFGLPLSVLGKDCNLGALDAHTANREAE